jgi:hypothetical protein
VLENVQCFSFSGNIGSITPKIIYLHYLKKNVFWIEASKKHII